MLVAAAARINLAEPKLATAQAAKRPKWQVEAWAYFDEVPELKQGVRYRGDQLAKLDLYAAVPDPDDPEAEPIRVTDPKSGVPAAVADAMMAELDRLQGEYGGHGEILRELSMNLDVAGECYLVGIAAHTRTERQPTGTGTFADVEVEVGEDWQIRSVSEVRVEEGRYKILADPGDQKPYELKPGVDDIMRIWQRHPQWSSLPDCAMRGLLGECRTLQVLSQQVLAQAMRAVSAGLLTVPTELSPGPAEPTEPTEDGAEHGNVDPLDQALNDVLVRPIDDPSDPSTVQPGILRGQSEYLKPDVLRRITFYDAEMDTVLEAKIEARVQRIARGTNLPVEKMMGHQQTTFANAAQVDQDEFNDYLAPSAELDVDALTSAFARPQWRANPAVPDDWAEVAFVWYDASDLIAQPDPEKNADRGAELGAISLAAWRKAKGFSKDDAPDPVERLVNAGLRRGILTGDLTLALMELMGVDIAVETPADVPTDGSTDGTPPADGTNPDAAAQMAMLQALLVASGTRVPVASTHTPLPRLALPAAATPNYGRQLMDLDRDLRTKLVSAAGTAMELALDRAASTLRSRTNGTTYRQLLRDVPKRNSYAHLGATLVAAVLGDTDPLAGAWDDLEQQFMEWGAHAQAEAIDVAGQVAAGFSASERSALQLRQASDLGEAWAWMRGALTNLAEAQLYDPTPVAGEVLGEFDPTLRVPTGLVREAMARAGGATGLVTDRGGVWLPLTDAGTRPAGGIGTGELLRGAMRDAGASVEAYEWVYGPAYRQRPFEPHLALDGLQFRNFDDPSLANTDSFPEAPFYMPGDHAGCVCDFTPVIVPAQDLA